MKTALFETAALSVFDYRCTMGPGDTPFIEQHTRHSLSYVRSGSFGYNTRGRSHELVAGSVMVGHAGDEYSCSHDHHVCGDECLSFQLSPSLTDDMGLRKDALLIACVPPTPELMVYGELAQAAGRGDSDIGIDEAAMLFVNRFIEATSGKAQKATPTTARDRRRAVESALWIDAHADRSVDLQSTAKAAGVSPFHFLRLFSQRSASRRINIWCARGCAMPRGGSPMTTARSPTSPMTSALPTFPTSCAPSIAPPASRR